MKFSFLNTAKKYLRWPWHRSRYVKAACLAVLSLDILLQPWLGVPHFSPDDIAYYRGTPLRLHFIASITSEPDVRSDAQNLTLEAEKIFLPTVQTKAVHGKVMVKADRYPEYFYGDELDISCKLQTPPVFPAFSYEAYLAGSDIFALCTQPSIRKAAGDKSGGAGSWGNVFIASGQNFLKTIFWIKSLMMSNINKLFAEPQAGLIAGVLTGQRHGIAQDILDRFQATGLTHVLAVDGYKVSLMIAVLGYLGQKAARRRRYALVLFGILGLVIFSGFTASVLRAAWMASIAILAQAVGRKGSGLHLLLISAAVMVIMSPRMILVDGSFQYSFLATLGILLLMPKMERLEQNLLKKKHFGWIGKIPETMREAFWVTVVAQLFTLPLLLESGEFSLIAPVANLFVVPLLPWIIIFVFCALAGSFLFFPLGQLIAFVAYVFVTLMLFLADFFASLPFAAFHF